MKNLKNLTFVCTCIASLFLLPGCASVASKPTQSVTKAMTLVPPKPVAPDPESATQRDVANYIVRLRGWGTEMAIQLQAIQDLIKEEK